MKNYIGHKARNGLFQKIINEIPRFDTFHELFAGSAAISALLKVPAKQLFLNDLSPKAVANLRLKFPSTTVTNVCAISLIKKLRPRKGKIAVVFLDPPYLHSTRPNGTKLYDFEMSDADHVTLLEAVLQSAGRLKFIIIHPDCELYNTMLAGWRRVNVKVRYHSKTSLETIYMNFDANTDLQNYQYLGNDCWDRQRIKRKGDRWINKLVNLPVLEKNYIINRIQTEFVTEKPQ